MTLLAYSLEDWINAVQGNHPDNINLGLERIKLVGARANILNLSIPCVVVGGTNGKGSTVTILSKLLQVAGLNVGTYTSPHLCHFKERIRINGALVSESELINGFAKVEQFREEVPLTFFEFTTLVALDVFQQAIPVLDIIILEVGLGGRLDAVNVVTPALAVVTSIGLDHQTFLGESRECIAQEKAGIFRDKIPVIIGKAAKVSTLLAKAAALGSPCFIEGEHFDFSHDGKTWKFCNETNIDFKLYLPKNSVSLAMAAYTILSDFLFSLMPLQQIICSLKNRIMIGRFQPVILNNSSIIFDVGHNPDGCRWLAEKMRTLSIKGRIVAVWSSLIDKDLPSMVAPLKDIIHSWFIGKAQSARAAPLDLLKSALVSQNVKKMNAYETVLEAFSKALEFINKNDLIIVFGSFYTVSQIMQHHSLNIENHQHGLLLCDLQHLGLLNERD